MAGLGTGRARRTGVLRPLAALMVLSLALLLLRNADPIRAGSTFGTQLLAPLERVIADGGGAVRRFFQAIGEIETLRTDNARLRGEVDRLTLENVRLREETVAARQSGRLDALRPAPPRESIEAGVIARDPSGVLRLVVLDRGTDAGVKVGDVVVADRGVVGRVSETGPNYSKVLLITDSASAVSALVQDSRATGIVRGQYGDTLVMDWVLQTEPVKVGDVVLTAGLGLGGELRSLFPKGLVLGTVVEVTHAEASAYLRAIVAPAVDLRRLERVLVVKAG